MQADNGLIHQAEPVVLQGLGNGLFPLLLAFPPELLVGDRIVQMHPVAAGRTRHLAGQIGARDRLVRVRHAFRDRADADAGGDGQAASVDVEDVFLDGVAQCLGQGLGRVQIALAQQQGEGIVPEARGQALFAQLVADDVGHVLDHQVAAHQPDRVLDPLEVVQQDIQQEGVGTAGAGIGHGQLHLLEEVLAVVQAGEDVLLAEKLQLLGQFRVGAGLIADHDLGADLALDRGRGEFHPRLEIAAGNADALHLQLVDLLLLLVVVAQEVPEPGGVVGGDHVHDGMALDLLQVVEAEHLQIGLVGVDVHAVVDIGDGIARTVQQGATAFLALLVADAVALQLAPHQQIGLLAGHHQAQVVGLVIGHQIGSAGLERGDDLRLLGAVADEDHRGLGAVAVQQSLQLGHRHRGLGLGQDDQVGQLLLQRRRGGLERVRILITHDMAGIAQDIGNGLGVVLGFLDDDEAQYVFVACHGPSGSTFRSSGPGRPCGLFF